MKLAEMGFIPRTVELVLRLQCAQCSFEGSFEWEVRDETIWRAIIDHREQCALSVCAWCETERGDRAIKAGIAVTHKVCSECLPKVMSEIAAMHGDSTVMGKATAEGESGTFSHSWEWTPPQLEVK